VKSIDALLLFALTTSARTVAAIGEAIEAGMIGINFVGLTGPETPFGGVKESGHGSEGGSKGLDPYLLTKYVSRRLNEFGPWGMATRVPHLINRVIEVLLSFVHKKKLLRHSPASQCPCHALFT
jgi:hypothetical protein